MKLTCTLLALVPLCPLLSESKVLASLDNTKCALGFRS